MGHVLVDNGQIVSDVRAVAADDVEAALELLDMPTLPDTLRATRVHGTVCFIGMLTKLWTMNEFYPFDCIPRAHADRNRVSGKLVGVVDPADAAVTTKK